MTQWKLDCCRLDRHVVPVANGLDPERFLEPGLCGRLVVEVRTRSRIGKNAAVVDAAYHDPDALLRADRQQFVGCRLIEKGVAAGHKETIELGLAGEPREHRRLVHADSDPANGPASEAQYDCFLGAGRY